MNENRLTFASDYMEGAHPLILKRCPILLSYRVR